jgi:hypothetical protein
MKNIYILFAACALSGCGSFYTARVRHDVPAMPGAAAARPALSALYLVVRAAPPAEAGSGGLTLGGTPFDFKPSDLARRSARFLTRPGMRVCAWRVEKGAEKERFAAELKPTGILVLDASAPSLVSGKQERSTVTYDKAGKKQTVTRKVNAYSSSLRAAVTLYSWPALEKLDSWADVFNYAEDREDGSKDPAEWYADNEERLFAAVGARLAERYAGRPADRFRPVFFAKGDKASEEPVRLASRGDWRKAEELWAARAAAGGGWRDYLGLGVAAELRKDYAAAAGNYRQAQRLGAGDKDAAKIFWGQIFGDLELELSTAAAGDCGAEWFARRTAVLPFSDETTSIDGPPLVRRLVYERLKAAGYDLLTPDETDELLRRRGFSEGGQLTAAKPEEIAGWLKARRLLYGDITDFGEVIAGVYNRRMIRGSARLWEVGARESIFEESVVKVKTPSNFLGGLVSQLAKGVAERLKNKPLAYEAGLFSQQVAEDLPNRP